MAKNQFDPPEFFEDTLYDPVNAATGTERGRLRGRMLKAAADEKQKAGFYLSKTTLKRFNRTFYALKLEGVSVLNKSALLEAALAFALEDIEKGNDSEVLKRFL